MSLSWASDRASSHAWATTSSTSTGAIGCSGSTPSSRDRSIRSLMQRGQPAGLAEHPGREPLDGLRVVLRLVHGLGQQGQRADRGLQLVAHVGHEVTPGMVEALGLGDVVHEDQRRSVGHGGDPDPQADARLPAPGPADREVPGRRLVGGAGALHHLGDLGGVDRAAADHPQGLERGVRPDDGVRGVDPDGGRASGPPGPGRGPRGWRRSRRRARSGGAPGWPRRAHAGIDRGLDRGAQPWGPADARRPRARRRGAACWPARPRACVGTRSPCESG